MTEVRGQLSMFGPPPEPPVQDRRRGKKRRRSSQALWLGPGNCRACHGRLFLYLTGDGYRAWVQPNLVPNCPSCDLALTTTTVTIDDNGTGVPS